jgi:hypothetical protein
MSEKPEPIYAPVAVPDPLPSSIEAPAVAVFEDPAEPVEVKRPVRRSFIARVFRRFLRRFGIQKNAPVPRCTRLTQAGQPCRAPAMANGYCRMHGGSRHDRVAEAVFGLRDRVTGNTELSDSFGD